MRHSALLLRGCARSTCNQRVCARFLIRQSCWQDGGNALAQVQHHAEVHYLCFGGWCALLSSRRRPFYRPLVRCLSFTHGAPMSWARLCCTLLLIGSIMLVEWQASLVWSLSEGDSLLLFRHHMDNIRCVAVPKARRMTS